MIIVLTGGTGLIGQALGKRLFSQGHKIHLIARTPPKTPLPYPFELFLWPNIRTDFPIKAFPKKEPFQVIHLAGEPVYQWPWSRRLKEEIRTSRVESARLIISALRRAPYNPEAFLSAGAIGIYGWSQRKEQEQEQEKAQRQKQEKEKAQDKKQGKEQDKKQEKAQRQKQEKAQEQDKEQRDRLISESFPITHQDLFLQSVCRDWEAEVLQARSFCRTAIFRMGMVLSKEKGFLHEQIKWMKRGVRPFSSLKHWLSWIALEDLLSLFLWVAENPKHEGIYNAVSPKAVTLRDFYRLLAEETRRGWNPSLFGLKLPLDVTLPVPLFLIRQAGGEMAKNLLLSCRAFPTKALSKGFVFQKADLRQVLRSKNTSG